MTIQPSSGVAERPPLALVPAVLGLVGCVLRTAVLLLQRRIHLPRQNTGRQLTFADGSHAVVYRETVVDRDVTREPVVLVVGFRLRMLQGRAHRWFRVESILNTPLFVGFPGYVSKLWLTHDENGRYRGVYEWDGAQAAETYARTLWRVLALGSVPGSIHYRVLPGVCRDVFLRDPGRYSAPRAPAAPNGRHRGAHVAGPAPFAGTPRSAAVTSIAPGRVHAAGPAEASGPAGWWRPTEPISAKRRVREPV
ncbi:hypothetical protein BJQ94_13345 [Cryobacterium sp. SO2]|uniref:hypothetical protein n=1 Tax=Cryobacterium sp. SO2 TaxID=1897060 RepID=UPI00223DE1AF|nr:hypothetical protein [Cryobacterium sp. SO2]WEO76344.1 hypothetical protein BJQ94_13345 [Cryobacterium sp. SO2]